MGHGFQNKWRETAAVKWTQEMRDFALSFYLNTTSGPLMRTFLHRSSGQNLHIIHWVLYMLYLAQLANSTGNIYYI